MGTAEDGVVGCDEVVSEGASEGRGVEECDACVKDCSVGALEVPSCNIVSGRSCDVPAPGLVVGVGSSTG